MSNNTYYEYYNYLQYIKNVKVPPIYLNENGYVFATSPVDFSNNTISLKVSSPLTVDKNSLTLDTSANYNFSGSNFIIESSGIFMPNLSLESGYVYSVVYDSSTGKLAYNTVSSGVISNIVGGTNINVQNGNTTPIINLSVSSPIDLSNQPLIDSSYIDFKSNIDIRGAGLSYIYTQPTISGEIWMDTHGLGNDTIHLNSSVVDFSGASLLNVNDISAQSIHTNSVSLQNLYASGTISGGTIYANTALYTPLISSSSGQLTLQSDNVSNSITIDNTGTLNINGSTINIGSVSSNINMMGILNTIETTNLQIYDQLITLNKNGGNSTSYGSGFEIEASGSIVGYIKTDTTIGKSYIVKVPNSSTVYTMMLKDSSGNIDMSGNLSINLNNVVINSQTGDIHVGGAFDVSGNTVLSGNASVIGNASITGATHVGGAFDVSGATILNGQLTLNALSNVNKSLLLNIDPITDIVSYETHPTYTSPLSSDASNVISMTQASASNNGYLASGDWTNFNTMLSNISATAPLTFLNNVINISNVDLSGTNGYISSTQYQNITNSIVVAAGTAIAQVYYVAMNGNDASGNGSVTSPYATIQKAINQCTDASKYYTIYIAPYAYTESPTIGASISPRISIIGLTNNTNSKNVTITGSFTIAATTATGNETNNVIAFKNLTIQAATGNAINLTGQGFSLFVNNTNIAVTGTNTSSVINLASTSKTTRYYFDNVRLNNVAVASTNHMVNLVAGQIWSITNSDFTNANTGGSVIYSYDISGQLLAAANSSFTNTIYGNVFTIQANPSSCSISNTTLIGYNTDASAGLLVLGNGVAAGSGGAFSVMNSILYNTNSATSANTYIFLNGGATLISSANSFYSPYVDVSTFTPFGYKATKTNNIVRYTNSAYFSGNVAGTNIVSYPSVSAGIIVVENMLNDTNNLTNFNNASIKFNAIPVTTTDLSMVTYNTTTKQISYKTIPVPSAGSNIGISYSNNNPTISVAITSTLDMSNQGIIGISYERFANNISIQNGSQVPIIYTTATDLLLNPSGGVINTTSHNIDLSNASIVGISSEIFNTNMNIQVGGVATPIIYTTGTATDLLLNPSGGVINTTGHNIDMSNASIVGISSEVFTTNISLEANGVPVIYTTGTATDIILHPSVVGGVVKIINGHNLDMTGGQIINASNITSKSSTDLALIAGNGGSHLLLKTGNTPTTRMEIDNATIRCYLPLDVSNNYITNASYLNFANGINIQQNGVPRIYTTANNLIIDPSTNGVVQFAGPHVFDLCGGSITTATTISALLDSSMTVQYTGTTGSIYLKSATTATNKRMVLDNSGIHVSGTGVFDVSGITSNVVIDASGNLNMGVSKFTVAGSTGNMYVGGTMDVSGITTIAPTGTNKIVVDTTGTHSSGGIIDASGVLYKNTLSDASGNVYINGITQFTNEVDICSNTIKMNLPDGSSNTYYVSYNLPAKQLGYKKNVTVSSPLLLDGNNNLTYDYTADATYNNATTQINSTSLIGLSGGIVDICGVTAVNISGPTNMNGAITSAGANTWNGKNQFYADVSFNATTVQYSGVLSMTEGKELYTSTSKTFGMISPVSTFLRIGKIVSPYPATDAYFDFNNTGGSAIYGSDFFNINPPICNINSTTCDISSSTFKLRNIGTTSRTNFLAYNPIDGIVTYNPTTDITNALLASNNTWSGKNQFSQDVSFNSKVQLSSLTEAIVSSGGVVYRARNTTLNGYADFGINDSEAFVWNQSNTPTRFATNNGEKMRISAAGYVGIGETNPLYPLHIAGAVSVASLNYYDNGGNFNTGGTLNICLKVSDGTLAVYYATNSDTRIKDSIVDIDDEQSLQTLRLIKPKTYGYVDKVKRGNENVIGFIAQEIKAILPKAVTITKDYIPNFYTNCSVSTTDVSNIVSVTSPIDLSWNPLHDPSGNAFIDVAGNASSDSAGNKVFNVKLYDQSNVEIICKTTAILDKRSFLMDITGSNVSQDGYFLYGQEVDDFHNLDKNAIFTVVTAAVQDIDRIQQAQIQAQQASHTQMQTHIQAQQQADALIIESLNKQLSEQQELNATLISRIDTLTTQVATLISSMATLKQMFNL